MSRLMAVVAGSLVLLAVAVAVMRRTHVGPPELPVLGEVPEFHLIESNGAPFSQADVAGRPWVADFIFTQCPGICPRMSSEMQRLQEAWKARDSGPVTLVSFSVDPKNDTPDVLRAYAQRYSAGPQWRFVTGERAALYQLVFDGFKLPMAERSQAEAADGEGLITHSDRFVLVDQKLRIRGYYQGTDRASVDQLLNDLVALQAQGN